MTNFCKDCKHYELVDPELYKPSFSFFGFHLLTPPFQQDEATCCAGDPDLITGEPIKLWVRRMRYDGPCGVEGKLFEGKEDASDQKGQ